MQESARCPECILSISDWYGLFKALRGDKIDKLIKEKNTNIDASDILNNYDEDLEYIFDMIGITKFCCRTHFTCSVDFYDYHRAPLN